LLIYGLIVVSYFFLSPGTGHRLDENNVQLCQHCCSGTSDTSQCIANFVPHAHYHRHCRPYYPLATYTAEDLKFRARRTSLRLLFSSAKPTYQPSVPRCGTRVTLRLAHTSALWCCRRPDLKARLSREEKCSHDKSKGGKGMAL
jgi:hypothetical protein